MGWDGGMVGWDGRRELDRVSIGFLIVLEVNGVWCRVLYCTVMYCMIWDTYDSNLRLWGGGGKKKGVAGIICTQAQGGPA